MPLTKRGHRVVSGLRSAGLVGTLVLAMGFAGKVELADAQESGVKVGCRAHVILFEDGSYSPGRLTNPDGSRIAARWKVTPPPYGAVRGGDGLTVVKVPWPVAYNGTRCEMVTAR